MKPKYRNYEFKVVWASKTTYYRLFGRIMGVARVATTKITDKTISLLPPNQARATYESLSALHAVRRPPSGERRVAPGQQGSTESTRLCSKELVR